MDMKIKEVVEGTTPAPRVGIMQDLQSLAQALALAVDRGFMKREHAGAIWKRILTITGVDTTKKEVNKDDIS